LLSRQLLLALLVAGFCVTTAHADDDDDKTPGWTPVWTARATSARARAAFPKGVTESGRVVLDCAVAKDGKLVDCKTIKETPVGLGFGAAALNLVTSERVKTKDQTGASTVGRRLRTGFSILAPGDAEPNWLKKPTAFDLAGVFPVKAINAGRVGRASINCKITVEGFLEACKVRDEDPIGLDFGLAALQLAPQLRMTPRIRGGKPVPGGEVTIPIIWAGVPSPDLSSSSVVLDPPWIQAPTQAQVNAAWPKEAAGLASGQAALRCDLDDTGGLRNCDTISESPNGKGFGRAAKTLSKAFKVTLDAENPKPTRKYAIDIPFRFRDPATPDVRKLTKPRWIETLTADGMASVYPEAATKAGVKSGSAAVRCLITPTGALSDCQAVREAPAGLDFGAAAIKAVSLMRMNPWTKEGDTVDGLTITIPIAFSMSEGAPVAPTPKTGGQP
jgi:TonB family protein